jgi:antitoxin (DNA-binding transcriptional repressor) of toxin-antitoxin stability system
MAMHAISVKELRQRFPFVQSELKKGESFLLICKSKPIAEIKPIQENGNSKFELVPDEEMQMFEKAALEDMNNALGDDYLTQKEIDYYLSLPPLT